MQAFSDPSMEATKQGRQNPHLLALLSLAHFSLFSFLFSFMITTSCNAADSNLSSPYHPTEVIALSCGSSAKTSTPSLFLTWNSDTTSKFGPFPSSTTTTATATTQAPSVPMIPYMTARLSTSRFNYTFPVSNGMKFIRLHFYPASYSGGHDISNSFFSVTVNDRFTLLSNFSASLTALSLQTPKFVKEYSVNVEDQKLRLSFAPSPENPNSFAFINGIEIVSMPKTIYIKGSEGSDSNIPIVGEESTSSQIDYNSALETIHRLNVGGISIPAEGDSGMFREWVSDDQFIVGYPGVTPAMPDLKITYSEETPAYIAPENVYCTARTMGPYDNMNKLYNLTWLFKVDSGFSYLVRLHFCEIFKRNITEGDTVFHIFINSKTVSSEANIFLWSDGIGFPIYRDYFVLDFEGGDLSVALHPNPDEETTHSDAILNGLELFKLSSGGNLAGPNPEPTLQEQVPSSPAELSKNTNPRRFPVALVGSLVASVVVFSLLLCTFIWWHRQQRRRKVKDSSEKTSSLSRWWVSKPDTHKNTGSSLPSDLCRHFSLAEIRAATNDFDSNLLIGMGGFGHVYKGYVGSELNPVAVKRAKLSSQQGSREFQNEIEMLSKLRHVHLASLIGYCDEQGEMVLVYDYMAQGTLRDHLYKSNKPPLSWKQRLNICIGAARGLYYLHTGAKHTIIHRDVKTTNILLDDKWVAKVSDFGLSKVGPTGVLDSHSQSHSHVSTVVKGTLGYLDPEYFLRQQLTTKSDVYSFGVVLFEVLCARPALLDKKSSSGREREEVSLAEWALLCQRRKMLHQIIDPHLKGTIAAQSLERFAEIAENCLAEEGNERPSMGDVVWSLEFALQLQETAERNAMQCLGNLNLNLSLGETDDDQIPLTESFVAGIRNDLPSSSATDQDSSLSGPSSSGQGNSSEDASSRSMSKNVFSELMNPNGR